jgi:RNA polymerase sigma-70 factor (ECF subfamily)
MLEKAGESRLRPGSAPAPGGLDAAADPSAAREAEDTEWVLAFQAGKEEGFNRLVLKHKDRIFSLCRRMLGDADDADDAAQEAFVRVFHGLGEFRRDAKFSTWLYRIAVNVCKNKLDSKPYRESRERQSLEDAELEGATAGSAPTPAQELEAKGRRQVIEEAIARLPEDQRMLVLLRDVEGRSYEEIAETTGLNEGTVKSRLNRGRRRLQEWLKELW